MYLHKLYIKNLRGISELTWYPNKKRNVLIGPNGSGKSTIALALDYLLNPFMQWYKKKLPISDYNNRDINKEIIIEAWFKDLEDFITDDNELLLQHVKDGEIVNDGDDLALILQFRAGKDLEPKHNIICNGLNHILTQKQKDLIGFYLVSADRIPEKEMSFHSNSLLTKNIQSDTLQASVQTIIEKYEEFATEELLENEDFMGVMNGLSKSFFEFNIVDKPTESVVVEPLELTERKTLQTFSLMLNNAETKIPLKNQSKGIKNAMLLLTLVNELKNKGIIYLEEPEQNLEPQLQRRLMKNLCDSSNGQLFVTTHSGDIVKRFDYDEIFIVGNGTVNKVPRPTSIHSSLGKRYEKYEKSDMIDGLFSNLVLIVEGASELGAFPIYSELHKYGLEYSGVKIICADGKAKIQYFAEYYAKSGKAVLCLLDNDSDIQKTINDIKRKAPDVWIMKQKDDYEASLFEMNAFTTHWKSLFEELEPFSKYKSNYFKPFKENLSKSPELIAKSGIFEDVQQFNNIDDILESLEGDEEREYIKQFLHILLSGVLKAKDVSVYLADKSIENGDLPYPKSFEQLINVTNIIQENTTICDHSDKCILRTVEGDTCSECFEDYDLENKVFTIKGA